MISGDYAPNFQKLSFYYFFEKFDYEKIFLLDCDAVISDICPNIFEYDTVSGVTNIPKEDSEEWPSMKEKFYLPADTHPKFLNQLENHDISNDYDPYFCSGIVMFTRDFYEATKDHWIKELEYRNTRNNVGYHDQTVLNCLAYKYYPHYKINLLPEDWGAWWKDSKYINHVTAERKDNYQ
jgi:predicted PolB exonuclease-like 3'-5' exonuclease